MTNASPVRWGVLSTAAIGLRKVLPGMMKSDALVVAAIASRGLARATAAAGELGIARAYGSYEELLADPAIEAIYNPLPNHLHVPLTLAAAQAGKHVLCEKPMALTAAEVEQLRPHAGKVHLREAFMVRHHPQWLETRALVRAGRIGELRSVDVQFCYRNLDPANIRNMAAIGGGALYDIGCYAIVAGRWFFGAEPLRAAALVDRDPGFGTDTTTSGLVDFGGGRQLVLSVSTRTEPFQRVLLRGDAGRIEIEIPFNAPQDAPCRYRVDDELVTLPVADQYRLQAEDFSHAVRTQTPDAAGLDEAIGTLRVIDALFASERSGRFEPV